MSAHDKPIPVEQKFFTFGTVILVLIMGLGAILGLGRYAFGLEWATNLTDTFPWGIWKAVNVAAVAALGSSAFTMTSWSPSR